MAQMEVLTVMEDLGEPLENEDLFQEIMDIYLADAEGLLALQSDDGRWHNVLTEEETYLESSASAMFILGMLRGVERGWSSSSRPFVVAGMP